jgi:hypothetical protein
MNTELHAQDTSPNSSSDRRERGPSRRFTPHGHASGTTGHLQVVHAFASVAFAPLRQECMGAHGVGSATPLEQAGRI